MHPRARREVELPDLCPHCLQTVDFLCCRTQLVASLVFVADDSRGEPHRRLVRLRLMQEEARHWLAMFRRLDLMNWRVAEVQKNLHQFLAARQNFQLLAAKP